MKKNLLGTLLLAGSLTGCFTWPHDPRSPNGPLPGPVPLPSTPITADQVEAANAHRVAEAVWDELDRDQQKEPVPAPSTDPKKR